MAKSVHTHSPQKSTTFPLQKSTATHLCSSAQTHGPDGPDFLDLEYERVGEPTANASQRVAIGADAFRRMLSGAVTDHEPTLERQSIRGDGADTNRAEEFPECDRQAGRRNGQIAHESNIIAPADLHNTEQNRPLRLELGNSMRLPALAAAQRVVVRVASRTHYVVDVRADADASGNAYQFADDNDLRALPNADHGTRSAFGPDGLVPGTEGGERFLFWPMGIDNSGAMRHWGNPATAFIGRRHFDDADLIERRFETSPGGQASLTRPK